MRVGVARTTNCGTKMRSAVSVRGQNPGRTRVTSLRVGEHHPLADEAGKSGEPIQAGRAKEIERLNKEVRALQVRLQETELR